MLGQTSTTVATRVARTRAPKAPTPMSAAKRKTLATERIATVLGATSQGKENTAAITAALEIISERLAFDTEIQRSLQAKYNELLALGSNIKPPASRKSTPTPFSGPDLDHYSPYGKLDPYKLLDRYQPDQLRDVLALATPALLREAVDVVQARASGPGPTSRSRKLDMVNYIMQYVAPGH